MADERKTPARDPKGTAGRTDLAPLRGGMREVERGKLGPEHAPEKEPAAPYHGQTVPEGGLAPRGEPGEGPTPPVSRGELEATAGRKIAEERGDFENQAGNTEPPGPGGRKADR